MPSQERRVLDKEHDPADEVASTLRVTYAEVDRMGVVYYGNYMRFFEVGRAELFRARGRPYKQIEQDDGVILPVVEAYAHYHRSARYDDRIEIRARVLDVGYVRIKFGYRIFREGDEELLVEGYTVHGCIDKEKGKLVRLPDIIRDVLLRGAES